MDCVRRFAIGGSGVVAAAICYLGVGAAFCAATLHVPRVTHPRPFGATNVVVRARDGVSLRAWWLEPGKSNGSCVMVLHGIADSRAGAAGFAPMFLEQGYRVLLPDSRAHGESGGEFITYGLLEKYDAIAWAHWLHAQGCRGIYGLGESLGGSILIQAASVAPVFRAIVAECPYADLREIGEYRVRGMAPLPGLFAKAVISSGLVYARFFDGLDLRQVSPVKTIAWTATPILLIHGLRDFRTPPSQSRELAAANPHDPLWLVPNAGHCGASAAAPVEFRRRVLGWFEDHS